MFILNTSVNTSATLDIVDQLNNSGYETTYRTGGNLSVKLIAGDCPDIFEATIAKYYPELAIERSYLFSHLVTSTETNRDTIALRTIEVDLIAIRETVGKAFLRCLRVLTSIYVLSLRASSGSIAASSEAAFGG